MNDKKTILIVDDDPDFLLQLQLTLQKAGYEVKTAERRADAESIIDSNGVDAMIVDLMMEENDDGFALCYYAKRKSSDLPVILVTGVASETGISFDAATDEERAWVKADVLLAKPVRGEQVLGELVRLMA